MNLCCCHCHSRRREEAKLAERRRIEAAAQQLAATQAEIASLRSELMAVKTKAAQEAALARPDSIDSELDASSITCAHHVTVAHTHLEFCRR